MKIESSVKTIAENSATEFNSTAEVELNHHEEKFDEEIDDDGQWSDWDEPIDSRKTNDEIVDDSTNFSSFDKNPSETKFESSFKLNRTNAPVKSQWDPNAPLGSEFEIRPVDVKNKISSKNSTTEQLVDEDDFFKDMAPKVRTVQLMDQIELLFKGQTVEQSEEKIVSESTTEPKETSSSNKFGIVQLENESQIDVESTNNWDD